jgi:hypothetical protein
MCDEEGLTQTRLSRLTIESIKVLKIVIGIDINIRHKKVQFETCDEDCKDSDEFEKPF